MSVRKTNAFSDAKVHMTYSQSSTFTHCRLLLNSVLVWALASSVARALPPLVPAADVAQDDLQAWWKPGDLVVGIPCEKGRPGMRPLVDLQPRKMPQNAADWTVIGTDCPAPTQASSTYCGHPIQAEVTGDKLHPKLRLLINGRVVAENLLGRPAVVCELHIGDADAVVGPELIVSWRPEKQSSLRGLTVYRIPEALHPPCEDTPD